MKILKLANTSACLLALAGSTAYAEPTKVNVMNYITAQTAMQFDTYQKQAGGVNKVLNNREPVTVDNQPTIRMNRDTIYSMMVLDISEGATVTLPDAGSRYRSMMIVNEDNYINAVYLDGGAHELTKEQFRSVII